MRISVIGHAGSGKSTLAAQISKKLGISHIHIDRFWFEAGGLEVWKRDDEAAKDRVRAIVGGRIREAIAQDSWVSDGLYSRYQDEVTERADVLIYLNIPLIARWRNHFQRALRPSGRHKELTWWDEIHFFYEMTLKTQKQAPRINALVEKFKDKVIVLHSRKEVAEYLAKL